MALFDTLKTVLMPYAEKINQQLTINADGYKLLPENVDLDEYTTPGVWRISTAARAQTVTHCPSTLAGTLTIIHGSSAATVIQTYMMSSVTADREYRRMLTSGGTWSDWVQISPTEYIASLELDILEIINGSNFIKDWVQAKYIPIGTVGQTVDVGNPSTSASWSYIVRDCTTGDKFKLFSIAGSTAGKAWTFVDSSNVILSVADDTNIENGTVITAPEGASKVIFNNKFSTNPLAHIIKLNPQVNP